VKLSQLALKDDGGMTSAKELKDTTAQLLEILRGKCRGNTAFDDNLANYVFFPLSHVLRLCQKRTGCLAELATRCLRELLEHGWRTLAIELGQQLLLLLTFFAGGGPSTAQVSEELQTEAYGALAALFKILHNTPRGAASLVEASTIPTLGQCLTVILDGITDGPSSETQLEALLALKSLWSCIKDKQALSNFLPGTVSALTKCLMPTTKAPRSRKVLINALEVFQKIMTTTLSDVATRSLEGNSGKPESSGNTTLSKSWLIATGTQIKLALANITKLRSHEHHEVREALAEMCIVILDECHASLVESAALLVETALTVASSNTEEDSLPPGLSLQRLAVMYPSVSELIKSTIYNWVTSLPRVMQGSDEPAKQSTLRHISKAQAIFSDLGLDSAVLSDALVDSLRNSVVGLLELPSSKGASESFTDISSNPRSLMSNEAALVKHYRPIVMPHGSQTQTREQLDALLANIGSPDTQINMARDLLVYMRNSSGHNMLSAFWLSFKLLQAATARFSELDALIDQSLISSGDKEIVLSELYTHSVSSLSDLGEDDMDWRIQAVSLEVVAYTASNWGEAFRPDLVDTLYPVVHLLGSPNSNLREHAIASLNIISDSCGYSSTSEMITSNVDYLVNAISLKLNTFDISPQAPQVLVMMIRLSGPSLLPYLDDVVGSIFAALDNFHGYPRLVESLFTVLGEIVEESGKSGQLQIKSGSELNHRKEKPHGSKIEDIMAILKSRTKKTSVNDESLHENFPEEPWKDAKTQLDEMENLQDMEETTANAESGEIQKPPPTKVYTMVQGIVRLGQHYLTNQSPHLRAKLLDLINTASEALYKDEDQYLPLVNDVWPVLIKRLYDEEPFVVIAASRAVAGICKCAGDFMSTRIQVEWRDIMKQVRHAKMKATAEKKGRHGRGVFSQTRQVWEAFIKLLITIVEYVRIDGDMFDEALEILAELIGSREDVRNAFSAVNADAVWLQELRQGLLPRMETPVMVDIKFTDFDGGVT
jgi:TELO2-interacting protein 1